MSYCYDVMSRVWYELQDKLPPEIKDGEVAIRFGFLIEEMHEANHRLKDAINHDIRVSKVAAKLDKVADAAKSAAALDDAIQQSTKGPA